MHNNQLVIKSRVELEVNSITTNIKVGHLRTDKYHELDYMVCVVLVTLVCEEAMFKVKY